MYESKISNVKWIICDVPGNVGWLMFLAGLFLCFTKRPEIMENQWIFAILLLEFICGAAMIVGIGELISERICRMDRILPKKRLYRGFGALTLGGLAGMILSLPAVAVALLNHLNGVGYLGLLCGGGFLCFVFVGLILKEYKKIQR